MEFRQLGEIKSLTSTMCVLALRFNYVVITGFHDNWRCSHISKCNHVGIYITNWWEKEHGTGDYNCLTVFIGFYGWSLFCALFSQTNDRRRRSPTSLLHKLWTQTVCCKFHMFKYIKHRHATYYSIEFYLHLAFFAHRIFHHMFLLRFLLLLLLHVFVEMEDEKKKKTGPSIQIVWD